jgi:hypothetical protein
MTKTIGKSSYGRPLRHPDFLLFEYTFGEFATQHRARTTTSSSRRATVRVTKNSSKDTEKITKPKKTTKKTSKREHFRLEHEDDDVDDEIRAPRSGVVWEYEDKGWFPYDPAGSDAVEKVYQQWVKNPSDFDVRNVKSGQFSYMVDFRKMTQMNTVHENHTIRNIRRQRIKRPSFI